MNRLSMAVCAVFAAYVFPNAKAAECSFGNEELDVRFDRTTGLFDARDKRSGREWKMCRDSSEAIAAENVVAVSNGVDFTFRTAAVSSPVKASIRLEWRELKVTLASDLQATVAKQGLNYPLAFESRRNCGERILLPICCGHAFAVESNEMRDSDFALWTRNGLKMGCWGHYAERPDASGRLLPGAAYLAIVETQPFGSVAYRTGKSGLKSASIRWAGARGIWKEPRTIRYVFFAAGGPMEMAKHYRRYAEEQGFRVTFREKARRNPKLNAGLAKLAGAPNVWYRDMDGDKVSMIGKMKSIGFDNFLFSYILRKDLGCWVTPDEVAAIAKIPGVLQSEYDIFTDLIDPKLADQVDCMRPHWPEAAWDRDDIVREQDGRVRYGWMVARKDDPKRRPSIGCALLCEARALPYMRERVGRRMSETSGLGARFIDVTGTIVQECHNPKHPLDKGESAVARRKMLGMLGEEYGLVAGTESGLEFLVPVCDYFEGNFSSFACGSGRDMWDMYDEVPKDTQLATDPRNRVPFWEMVYHDCVASYWYWCDYNNKYPKMWRQRDLLNAVTGTPPMYLFTRENFETLKSQLAESLKVTTPVARATFDSPMSDYRWLTADRLVQQSVFENGVSVTVNFSLRDYRMSDGFVLKPMSHRIEVARRKQR